MWPGGRNGAYGSMWLDGRSRATHRTALALREPPPFAGALAVHGPCHNPLCMNYRHLSWADDAKNNGPDRLRDGTSNRGERHGKAKLRLTEVLVIKAELEQGTPMRDLATRFDVHYETIRMIKDGRSWGWA